MLNNYPPTNTEQSDEDQHQSTESTEAAPQEVKRSRLTKILVSLLLFFIVILTGLLGYSLHKHSQHTTSKEDIPVLSYGTDDGEVPQYPVSALDSSIDTQISAQLFEGLVQYRNQTDIVPWLATSWSNPNNVTWIFNLRHNVKFHSGRTMTAADVKYTLDYAVAHQNDLDGASIFALASTIQQVDVLNPYTIKVTTMVPDPVLLNKLSFFGIVDSKAKLGSYDAGTGPYIVKPGTKPTQSSIKLAAFNGYWAGHVYTREVDVTIYQHDDKLAADAAAGKLDLSGDFDANQLSRIKHYQPISVPDLGLSYLGLATEKPGSPLQSLAARQAIMYGLNNAAILKSSGLRGQVANQLVPLQLAGYNSAIAKPVQNLTKARQLLASVPHNSVQLTLAYPAGDDPQVNEIARELDAAGFNIKPISVSDFDSLINDTTDGKYDLFYLSDSSDTVDGLDILSTLLVGNSDYDNPQIDSLITQTGSTFAPAERIKLMQNIATIVDNEKPIIPLYTVTRTFALTKPYALKVDLPSLGSSTYFWKVYQTN